MILVQGWERVADVQATVPIVPKPEGLHFLERTEEKKGRMWLPRLGWGRGMPERLK